MTASVYQLRPESFRQGLRGPDAELSGLAAVHPVADGDNPLEVVVLHVASRFSRALGANCFHFGNGFSSQDLLEPLQYALRGPMGDASNDERTVEEIREYDIAVCKLIR
jgi:hypothetical protein